MFGVGSSELLLILLVALLVYGPGRLPEIARVLGRLLSRWRDAADEVKREVFKE